MLALPTVILLVVALIASVSRWSTRRMPATALVATGLAMSLALLVPTAMATWEHAFERVEDGELEHVETVCAAFRPGDVALMVDSRAANEWPQVLRGQCGVSALSTTAALRRNDEALFEAVGTVEEGVEARGARLVLVAADSEDALRALGIDNVQQVLGERVREDARLLEERPDHLIPLGLHVWLGRTG